MELPFGTAEFLAVFACYNTAVWPMQIVLYLLAWAAVALWYVDRPVARRAVAAVIALFWVWMALAYHWWWFAAINPAAWLFGALFLLHALQWLWWGVVHACLTFRWRTGWRGVSGALCMVFALVMYPALNVSTGHGYPAMPTFGLPCPTTIFTLGVLLLSSAPRSMFVIPLCWSAVGAVAAFRLGMYEDMGLLVAGIVALAAMVLPLPDGSARRFG